MEKNETVTDEEKNKEIELKKLLQASLNKKNTPVELGDVSKWEKIEPITLILAKKLGLDLNESYLHLLQNEKGLYTLIVGKYYQRQAEEQGLKDVMQSIEALLQKPGTSMEQLEVYAINTFKNIPNKKSILKTIEQAKKEVKKIQKLEDKVIVDNEPRKSEVYFEFAKLAFWKATYPLLGNIPYSLQSKIEEKVGKEYYNAEEASILSLVTNPFLMGGPIGYIIGKDCNRPISGAIVGVLGGLFLSVVRGSIIENTTEEEKKKDEVHRRGGMLSLELLAKPFEWMYKGCGQLYARAKENVEKRKGG